MDLIHRLKRHPVIAGCKSMADIDKAAESGVEIFFFLSGTIFDLEEMVARVKDRHKLAFVHVDLVQGLGKDPVGVEFLAQKIRADGILTTKSFLVKAARDAGLLAVQRLFVLDSEALRTGLSMLNGSNPDAVEILPALILPNIVHRLPLKTMPPVIAGGLVETREELEAVLTTPVLAVSTSRAELWPYRGNVTPAAAKCPE